MTVSALAKAVTESVCGCPNFNIGEIVTHPDGRNVKILGGRYWGAHGVSNHWTWQEVKDDGTLGDEECGYGWRPRD